MELFLAFNLESWGTLDIFDLKFDFEKLQFNKIEDDDLDEGENKEMLDLKNINPENRLILLFFY